MSCSYWQPPWRRRGRELMRWQNWKNLLLWNPSERGEASELSSHGGQYVICYLLAEEEENEEVQCVNVMCDPSDPWEFVHFKKALYQHQCCLAEQESWVIMGIIFLEKIKWFYDNHGRQSFIEFGSGSRSNHHFWEVTCSCDVFGNLLHAILAVYYLPLAESRQTFHFMWWEFLRSLHRVSVVRPAPGRTVLNSFLGILMEM